MKGKLIYFHLKFIPVGILVQNSAANRCSRICRVIAVYFVFLEFLIFCVMENGKARAGIKAQHTLYPNRFHQYFNIA